MNTYKCFLFYFHDVLTFRCMNVVVRVIVDAIFNVMYNLLLTLYGNGIFFLNL